MPYSLLGLSTKLRIATVSFVVSVRASIHLCGTTWLPLDRWFPTFFHLHAPWQPISVNCTLHISKMFVINIVAIISNLNVVRMSFLTTVSWTDHVRNEEVLLRVKEQRNILHEIRKQKANWIGHILRRNCLLQRVTEGKIHGGIDVTGRRERRRRKLFDDLKERRGYSHLKEEALDCTMWRARFERGFGPFVRQTTK